MIDLYPSTTQPICYETIVSGHRISATARVLAVNATVHLPAPVRVSVDIERGPDTAGWWIVCRVNDDPEHWFTVRREDLTHITAFVVSS
jgi:hypothetical protein